jgi:uncharacterized protein with PhoU and TrkA domain
MAVESSMLSDIYSDWLHHSDRSEVVNFDAEDVELDAALWAIAMEESRRSQRDLDESSASFLNSGIVVDDHPFTPGINLMGQVGKIRGSQGHRATEFANNAHTHVLVFGILIQSVYHGRELGPAGLNVQRQFGIHAIAIERDGFIDFLGHDGIAVQTGDVLWVGIEGAIPDKENHMMLKQVPSEKFAMFKEFVGSSSLKKGLLPVALERIPTDWDRRSPASLKLEEDYHIKICGVKRGSDVVHWPADSMAFQESDYLMITCPALREFVHWGFHMHPARRRQLATAYGASDLAKL